ncbi:hypothetical protein [Streptomyces sp. NPDC060035]|uniref:hypothetical protein n=1 Tax=Streptomyces sp. NPDC060035 TaxID=3347044 RepID=UPI00367B05C6
MSPAIRFDRFAPFKGRGGSTTGVGQMGLNMHGRRLVAHGAGYGLALLAVTSCTAAPPPGSVPPQSQRAQASPTASPSPPKPASSSGPAVPVGAARPTVADGPMLASVRKSMNSLSFHEMPSDEFVAVIRRDAPDAGELLWMKDDRTYCSAIVREGLARIECGSLPESWPRKGVLNVTTGEPYQEEPGEQPSLFVFLAVVEGDHGPYDYKGAAPEAAGPVHDAVVTFASGRKLGLISYEKSYEKHSRQIPETEICGADGAVCFPAYYPNR